METLYALIQKNAVEKVNNQTSLAFFNRLFLVPKPNNKGRPVLRISEIREIQIGDARKNQDFLANRQMGIIQRFYRRLIPYPNKPTVQVILVFSCSGSVLPIQVL